MPEPRVPSDDEPTLDGQPPGPGGAEAHFPPGTLLAGRYRVVYPLGQGGMGEVYRADDLKLGQPVALKFVRRGLASSAKRRLYDEVRLGRQVSHPNVCRLYDIVEVGELTFIAMEYVDGEDLASLLSRIGHLPPDKAMDVARDLCAGLQAAHDRGVLHRDLKPANVMVDGRGRARLTDFGLAVEQRETPRETAGTTLYMSPEQLAGGEATVKSDLFALGLVLYEMVAGRRFFSVRTLDESPSQSRSERLSRLGALSGQTDPAFQRVITQCLEERPEARPASARGILALLPGGDPLEAAIAAGQTPAPEVVAAAGTVGDLSAPVAWAALAAVIGAMALGTWISGRSSLLPRDPPPKTREVLVERARGLLSSLGQSPTPADWDAYYDWDGSRIRRVYRDDRSPDRFDRLRDSPVPPLLFHYRQSPEILVAANRNGVVDADDPPLDVPGMVNLVLDTQGRLLRYLAVPPRVEAGGPWPEPDWTAFFREADLGPSAFQPVPPEWSAPVDSDRKLAWKGHYPGAPQIPLRIEAASYHGRAVWFALLPPWAAPAPGPPAASSGASAPMGPALQLVLALALPLGGFFLVRRNLRLKRGDRRGSLRVALFVFVCYSLARLFRADHVARFGPEFWLLVKVLAYPMVFAALVWTFYMALEPYARRQWPRVLISWGRLLAGRWRDAMVGRDVLLGMVGAVAGSAIIGLWVGTEVARGLPQGGRGIVDPDLLTSWGEVGHRVFVNLHSAVLWSIVWLFVLVLLRGLLRRKWLTLPVWAALIAVQQWQLTGHEGTTGLLIDLLFVALTALLFIVVLTRCGLLGFSTMWFVWFVGEMVPFTFDGSLWWAPRGWALLAVLTALAVWAFRTALAGKPAVGDWLET